MSHPEKVKSVVMTAPGKVELQEFPWPKHLEPGALIAKVEMAGICGTDKHAFDGDTTLYGGTYCETGNFADTGSVPLNIHRQFAAKNVLFIGNANHPHDQYYVRHDMMVKYRHEFPLGEADHRPLRSGSVRGSHEGCLFPRHPEDRVRSRYE